MQCTNFDPKKIKIEIIRCIYLEHFVPNDSLDQLVFFNVHWLWWIIIRSHKQDDLKNKVELGTKVKTKKIDLKSSSKFVF